MNIAFDHQIFCGQQYGGISRYFCEIAPHIAAAAGTRLSIAAPLYINSYLRQVAGVQVLGRSVPRVPRTAGLLLKTNELLASLLLQFKRPDVVHETYYCAKRIAPRGSRTVVTVYDMIFEKFRNDFPAADPTGVLKEAAVKRADHVVCISHRTAEDLMDILGVPGEKISVVHLGCSLPPQARGDASLVDGPYLLYVGLRGGYKNAARLLEAYARSARVRKSHKLVFFGGGGFTPQEQAAMGALGLSPAQVLQLSGDDARLVSLYRHASLFVYPSLYEGFGVPPLEAMTFDCPVASSRAGSLPEVLGDAAQFFDGTDVEEMSQALEAVLDSAQLREDLVRRGRERSRGFTWELCAQRTMDVYRRLV